MTCGGDPDSTVARARDVELLVLDVDGVLTDSSVGIDQTGPDIYRFNVQDGSAVIYWHRCGYRTAIITGRASSAVSVRAAQLGIGLVYQNAKRKMIAYRQCLIDADVLPQQVCYVGDDLPDLPVMRHCGYPVAVGNAVLEVKAGACYVTDRHGGTGAVRQVVEHLLKAKGRWTDILQGYYQQTLQDQ